MSHSKSFLSAGARLAISFLLLLVLLLSVCMAKAHPDEISPVLSGISNADVNPPAGACTPDASFYISDVGNCCVLLTPTTLGDPTLGCYIWDYGDGFFDPGNSTVTHCYTTPGTYTITYTSCCGNPDGTVNTTSSSQTFTVSCCTPQFTWTEVNPCEVKFAGPDCNPCALYNMEVVWDFDDGSGLYVGTDPIHVFPSGGGSYNVCMTVNCVTDDGLVIVSSSTYCEIVSTSCCSAPQFTWAETNPCIVQFTGPDCDPCPAGGLQVSWDFGDLSTGIGANPTHDYSASGPGSYMVCMTVICEAADGTIIFSSTYCDLVTVVCSTSCTPCDPTFTVIDLGDCCFQLIPNICTGIPTAACDSWDFGDGTVIFGVGVTTYCFSVIGTQTICHTTCCQDADGNIVTSTYCMDVTCGCVPDNHFTYSPTSPCCYDFSTILTDPTVPPFCVIWDFDDGSGTVTGVYDVNHCFPGNGVYNVCLTNCCTNPDGTLYTETHCELITITDCCNDPHFTWAETNPCIVQFTGPDCEPCPASAMVVTWDFGDFTSGIGPNPTHDYSLAGPGSYLVCMTVTCYDAAGNPMSSTIYCDLVSVVCSSPCTPCDPFFNIVSFGACCFEFLPMTCISIPNYSCEWWDFGDSSGMSGSASAITHCYSAPGTYTVCHTTCCIDAAGNIITSTHCRDVTCGCVPNDDFTYTYSSPCCVDFSAIVPDPTIPPDCITWSFGDGSGDVLGVYDVSHCFPGNGVYNVCVTNCCLNADGTTTYSTHCEPVTITNCCACGPLATSFTQTNITDCCVEFVADVPDPTVPALTCVTWNFGDGSPIETGSYVANHCFPAPGVYTVCFTDCCLNADGTTTSYTTCQDVTITGGCCCPNPEFTWVFDSDCTIQFEGPSCTGFTGVSWTFGDGGTAFGINPNYTYTAGGTYTVCMTVYCDPTGGTGGTSTTVCHSIFVPCCAAGCDTNADFNWSAQCNDVTFTGLEIGLPSGCWSWDFGDGTAGSGQLTSHTYPGPGTYTACLTVCCFDDVWLSNTYCQVITIDPCCDLVADFNWTNECETYTFNGIDLGQPSGCWHWNFGDGDLGVGTTVTHTYAAPGTYNVCLTVCCDDPINQVTLVQTYCYSIVVTTCCDLDADWYWTGTFPTIDFTGIDLGDPSGCWHWNFGDGNLGVGQTISHTYSAPGTYIVCLDVCCDDPINQVTLVQSYCKTITIVGPCPQPCEVFAAFGHAVTSVSATGGTIAFTNNSSVGSFTSGPTSYFWGFGDSNTSTSANPVHTYSSPGTRNVCLTVTGVNADGITCSDIYCFAIEVPCLGDLDHNGVVNIVDLLVFQGTWGLCN